MTSSAVTKNYPIILTEIEQIAHQSNRKVGSVKLIAVTKNKTIQEIRALYDLGHRDFGENKVQELVDKAEKLPSNIIWHFIGRLQKNKVRKVLKYSSIIHSVCDLSLAEKISQVSLELKKTCKILLQVNTSSEESKQGLSISECLDTFDSFRRLSNIEVIGLMTMAPNTSNIELIRSTFARLASLKNELKKDKLCDLSMGMSSDYPIAIEEGATFIRIGSKLFTT